MLLTCTPHTVSLSSSLPNVISLPLFFPLYLHHLTPSLSLTFLPFSGLQTADRLNTKASYSSPRTAPSITPTGYSPWHCAKAHTHKLAWFGIEELTHTCTWQTSKQSAARKQCVDSQLILILWLCTIQYFFATDKLNAYHSQQVSLQREKHEIWLCVRTSSSDTEIICVVLSFCFSVKKPCCYQQDGLLLESWITWPLSNLCVSPGTCVPVLGSLW